MKIKYICLLAVLLAGCMTEKAPKNTSPYTMGNVQLHLKKGVTTKAQVLETFGAPNITTRDAQGREVWTYQKLATTSASVSGGGGAGGLLGLGLGGGGGASASASKQTQKTMTLIIKFNADDIVDDYESRYSSF